MCIPMMPCNCVCPPRCPPQETTTPSDDGGVGDGPKCTNGAPDQFFPDCCFNGGSGRFCCPRGEDNLHCCSNGFNNPWCGPVPTPAYVVIFLHHSRIVKLWIFLCFADLQSILQVIATIAHHANLAFHGKIL